MRPQLIVPPHVLAEAFYWGPETAPMLVYCQLSLPDQHNFIVFHEHDDHLADREIIKELNEFFPRRSGVQRNFSFVSLPKEVINDTIENFEYH